MAEKKKYTRGIVWFRNDLRLHDNLVLLTAVRECEEMIPIYIFEDREFENTK